MWPATAEPRLPVGRQECEAGEEDSHLPLFFLHQWETPFAGPRLIFIKVLGKPTHERFCSNDPYLMIPFFEFVSGGFISPR